LQLQFGVQFIQLQEQEKKKKQEEEELKRQKEEKLKRQKEEEELKKQKEEELKRQKEEEERKRIQQIQQPVLDQLVLYSQPFCDIVFFQEESKKREATLQQELQKVKTESQYKLVSLSIFINSLYFPE